MLLGLALSPCATALPQWSPAALFAAGEVGAWFDPADLTTMFQDAAGTIPAAVGQPVGLLLDKSQGVASAEQIVNGRFDADISGWVNAGGGTLAWADGGLQITVTGTAAFAAQSIGGATPGGRWYRMSGRARVVSGGGNAQAYLWDGTTAYGATVAITSASWTAFQTFAYLPATVTSALIRLRAGIAGAVVEFDDVSVVSVAGNHATQSGTARPTLMQDAGGRYYLAFDGVDDSLSAAGVNLSGTGKVVVVVGLFKASDSAIGVVVTHNDPISSTQGWMLTAPTVAGTADFGFRSRGSGSAALASFADASIAAPRLAVICAASDIAGPEVSLRISGALRATTSTSQGTGVFANAALSIGRRASGSPFNGRLYSLIVRGAASTAAQIAAAEAWVNSKTGAY